jgi:hypothetical protein
LEISFDFSFELLELIFLNFEFLINQNFFLTKPVAFNFLENFTKLGLHLTNTAFTKTRVTHKTFFIFLKNRLRHYEIMRYFLYSSFSQQVKIIDDINVPDILF